MRGGGETSHHNPPGNKGLGKRRHAPESKLNWRGKETNKEPWASQEDERLKKLKERSNTFDSTVELIIES